MDNTLKQRLIGAAVLVALAVIFLPMLIKGPTTDTGAEDISLRAPDAPGDGRMQTRELPLVVPAARSGESVSGMPAAVVSGEPAAPAAVAPAQAAAGDFAVNYGAYANADDAQTVITSLAKAGFSAFSEPTTINQQPAWRVRIGPFADRAAAESARLRAAALRADVSPQVVVLDGQGGEQQAAVAAAPSPAPAAAPGQSAPAAAATTQAAVPAATPATPPRPSVPAANTPAATPAPKPAATVAKPQPAPAPATPRAPAASAVGWVVQLGAFSNAAEAEALRERMRAAGFSAFVEQVPTDRGSLSRVRVGPVASREAAEQLKAQLAARTGSSGMVRQHP